MDSPTLANAPRSLSPGESIGATEFYEGARMVEPGFEPLEVTARERSEASTPECLPPGSNPGESTHFLSLASLAPVVRGLADPRERSAFAQSRETPRRLSTLAPSPTALGPGESIGATEFYEGARMVKPGFEPLEVTAWECSIARRDRRERLNCRAAKPRDERAPRNDFLWVQIPAGAERRPTLANASGFARSRETPGVS